MADTAHGQTMETISTVSLAHPTSETDLQKYLKQSAEDDQNKTPQKARYSPSISSNVDSYFNPPSLTRTESIFSFSRASFSSQISSLTSMKLPNPESLSASVSAIPTAPKAVRALGHAADQVQLWAAKAIKVLRELDADDDVEWAAAAGREGLDETDKAVREFETIIDVYVRAIEELQKRPDIGDVEAKDLQNVVDQMEATMADWNNVRDSLKKIHDQVELAMEWEELWGTVLGDVGEELNNLNNLVFEMEEKRHTSMREESQEAAEGIDFNELESFLSDSQKRSRPVSTARYSSTPADSSPPLDPAAFDKANPDTNLTALFARMQPLRASLDFLPMRLSMFRTRAESMFPAACDEVEDRRSGLEEEWVKLQKDADTLLKELGEDRWILVFRNAGRQAQKMCESVERSIVKLQEGLDTGMEHSNPSGLAQRIENFEAKRTHYGPAIDRVMAIIQKGVKDRVTVNGEILRLHSDMTSRIQGMHQLVKSMESTLEQSHTKQSPQLRDSISSIVTMDRSIGGSFGGTPGSSPASSVIVSAAKGTPPKKNRPASNINRFSSGSYSRRPATPLSSRSTSTIPARTASPSPGTSSIYRQGSYRPPKTPTTKPTLTPPATKPRWNSSGKTPERPRAYQRSPTVATTSSSPLTRQTLSSRSQSMSAKITSSPLSQNPTPLPTHRPSNHAHLASFAERAASHSKFGHSQSGSKSGTIPGTRIASAPVPPSPTTSISSAIGTIRSPSSLAVHRRTAPTMNRPPSALGLESCLATADSAIDIDDEELEGRLEAELEADLDREEEEVEGEGDSGLHPGEVSPSARPKLAAVGGNRRVSLLPMAKGRGVATANARESGRESALGNRPVWRG